ncbi:hypothetical protein DRH29_03115 [candidate division Kazan bacterium]|uniref:Uncharacterized protein n=1 Tax=candidate division Kazan bacterium TaxID=2202143 RepID=A0A420ZCN3_UNCK3|nr:MAG: hypothetical protein DRH29_03115 [candidate division Kazan bacterium]
MLVKNNGFKAQSTLVGLVAVFIMILFYSQIYDTIEPMISEAVGITDPATGAILSILPLIVIVAIFLYLIYTIVPGGTTKR